MMMRVLLAPLIALALAGTAPAQERPAPPAAGGAREGVELLEEGARRLLDSLIEELRPGISGAGRDLGEGLAWLGDLAGILGDVSSYERPEVLPNGDVLIRRKPGAAPPGPEAGEEFGPGGEIDL